MSKVIQCIATALHFKATLLRQSTPSKNECVPGSASEGMVCLPWAGLYMEEIG